MLSERRRIPSQNLSRQMPEATVIKYESYLIKFNALKTQWATVNYVVECAMMERMNTFKFFQTSAKSVDMLTLFRSLEAVANAENRIEREENPIAEFIAEDNI